MAVFPSARRAYGPVRRLPWPLLAFALISVAVSFTGPSLLDAPARDERPAKLTAQTNSSEHTTSAASEAASAVTLSKPSPVLASATEPDLGAPSAASEHALVAPGADGGTALIAEVSESPPVVVEAGVTGPGLDVQAALESEAGLFAAPAGAIERWAAVGVYIETEGQLLDDYSLANVNAALAGLPAGVLSSLGNPAFGPLRILVNAEGRTLSGDQPYRGPANFFSTNESTNELVLYPQQSVFTIVHELGHAYNLRNVGAGRYAMVLLDPEMRSFLAAAGWQVTSTDAEIRAAVDHMHVAYSYNGAFHWPRVSHDDPLEDFANSFATFFLDPRLLQEASPERYEWMAATFGR